jgi:MFS family permease
VARILVVALLARMPIGMVAFAMLMFLRESLGNFALAGAAVGINFVAMAAAAPVQGRLIDRLGPRGPLMVTGIVSPLALAALLAAASWHWPFAVVALFAAVAGSFASPITTLTRTIWRQRFDREEDRRTAFAFDSVTIELNFTLGPAIVASVLSVAGARAAFALSIAVVVFAFMVYMGSGILGGFRRVQSTERHLLGPLTDPRLWLVFFATFGLTTCFGLLEVGYPAYATFIAAPALAGVLLALNSLGSAVGGALYGGLHFKSPVERQFAAAMGLMAVPLALHVAFLTPVPLGILSFLVGGLIAPSITAQSVLVSRYAPEKYATEAFTWSSTFIVAGLGAGIALGGMLVESVGLRTAFGLGACVMATMSLLIFVALTPAVPATTV